MNKGFISIVLIIGISAITSFGIIKYVPISWFTSNDNLGTSVTTISTATKFSDFPGIYNTDMAALNAGKIEISTTTLPLLTTLTGVTSVGALSSGSLTTGFTAVPVALNGTGTTSPMAYRVMLGNGAYGLTVASSTGTSGQFLTSGGSGASPSWTTSAVDQTDNYNWTGTSLFTTFRASSTVAIGTSTPAVTGVSISGDVYIDDGGLGIGIATTTDNNLEVAGSTLISGDLHLTGTMYMDYEATSSAATALGLNDNDETTVTAYCSSGYKVVGGGFLKTTEEEVYSWQYDLNGPDTTNMDRWIVRLKCKVGGGCSAGNLTTHAICVKIQ